MDSLLIDCPTPVPAHFLALLKDRLPHSLALLRRAQFSHFPGGTSPDAHFLFASAQRGSQDRSGDVTPSPPRHFAAAYLDLSQHPETQMFLYSTLQDSADDDDDDDGEEDPVVEHVLGLCAALFHRVRLLAAATPAAAVARGRAHGVMVGSFHEATHRRLVARRGLVSSYWNPHDVWLFHLDELPLAAPAAAAALAPGLVWSVVRREDVPLIASRTTIPKVADTLMKEPSVAVRDGEGALVAWGFMGAAGTLSTLHVEVILFSFFCCGLRRQGARWVGGQGERCCVGTKN